MAIADLFSRTAPARYLEERRRNFPPKYRMTEAAWKALIDSALALSTPELRALAQRGTIVSGEIGELKPSTYVTRRGRGYAVEMHSGMMRLIYSAARAIVASDSGKFRKDKTPALSLTEVVTQIADLFRNYDEQKIATAQIFPITASQSGWADLIAVNAERFLLMHELAHIHNGDLSLWRNFLGAEGNVRQQEVEADATAFNWMIDYLLRRTSDGPQHQMLYAGAEFGLRVRMAMETVGMRFNKTHPPAGDRILAMRERLRNAAGPREFYAVASRSIALDQMWRAIELVLRKESPVFEPQLDDVLGGIRTLTVEFISAESDTRREEILEAARVDFRDIPQDLRDAANRRVGDVFEPGSAECHMFLCLLNSGKP